MKRILFLLLFLTTGMIAFSNDISLNKELARQGDISAQLYLGKIYREGKIVPINFNESFKWYEKAAEQNNAEAQFNLALLSLTQLEMDSGEKLTFKDGVNWLTKAAYQGYPPAELQMGYLYYDGVDIDGVYIKQNYIMAFKWFKKAADKGDIVAQFYLAGLYYNGTGTVQSYFEAFKWYKLAAEQGLAEAQFNLGAMYANGKGVRQDYYEAKEWFGKSCDNGSQKGCDAYKELNLKGAVLVN
ncbi:sel1 repeat family protein [Ignatzschineria indica]|uniref:tetratricopeptide repeat protein n=1 Tax=Ignatzschineria indica TaxID=472583 RepID=UPI0025775E5A|nr:tetratricopeptide repeat protein [Ignatzschineria indica]MDM1546021.1 sel1 repeat family protein [Ignatzschineria indica]